ncbi:MAG: HU family DNA-binding protein, partial [Bacteroidota bacterium]
EKTMNKKKMIDNVAAKMGTTKKQAGEFWQAFEDEMMNALQNEGEVKLTNFATMRLARLDHKWGRHPKTGEKISIPGHWAVRIKPSAKMKKIINKKSRW